MRLSRSRVLLRVVLLTAGGVYMLARGWSFRREAISASGAGELLGTRVSLVWSLVGVLALVTAASAAWSLRRRTHHRTLRLGDAPALRAPQGPPGTGSAPPGDGHRGGHQ